MRLDHLLQSESRAVSLGYAKLRYLCLLPAPFYSCLMTLLPYLRHLMGLKLRKSPKLGVLRDTETRRVLVLEVYAQIISPYNCTA